TPAVRPRRIPVGRGERSRRGSGTHPLRVLAQLASLGELDEGAREQPGRRRASALAQLLLRDARIEGCDLGVLVESGGELQLELAQQGRMHVQARVAVEEDGAAELCEPLQ